MSKRPLIVGLGEILWDFLPSRKVLGGAPANFAYMAKVLGDEGIVASRVGHDRLGSEACQVMHKLGLCTSYLQNDDQHETGTAEVSLDFEGQPIFTIKEPAAWDFLQWTSTWEELSAQADVVCFGSLAQRSPVSALTIDRFLHNMQKAALRICDANLRAPFFSIDTLRRSFELAHIVKVNYEELLRISVFMAMGTKDEEAIAKKLMHEFDLRLVCITRGAKGSLLVSHDDTVEHAGFRVKVADAVGAGDAFTACLAHYYIRGNTLGEISERANRFGSWVATQDGATPLVESAQLRDILMGTAQG
jgi:fructokinase